MMTLFSPISITSMNQRLQVKVSGESEWTEYALTPGSYATLPDLLQHLNEIMAGAGFNWSLVQVDDLAGLAVQLVHASPFELAFDEADGCHTVLGFVAQTYNVAAGVLQSEIAPQLAVSLGDCGQLEPGFTTRNAGGQLSLSGDVAFSPWSQRAVRRLCLRGLSPTRWDALLALHEAAATGAALYLATDLATLAANPAWPNMHMLRPNWNKQTALVGKRSWPAPHPLFIDADFELEAI